MSKIGNGIVRSIPFTPDCQNKWDLDGTIIGISSRGYNREEKSFYVGYYFMGKTPDATYDVFNYMNECRRVIIEDELFDTNFKRLKRKVKQWYKDHFVEALEKALKMAKEN